MAKGIHDIEPPALPGCALLDRLVPDVINGLQCHALRAGQVRGLNAGVIQDGFGTVRQAKAPIPLSRFIEWGPVDRATAMGFPRVALATQRGRAQPGA
jgi:hypothetical protein